MKTPLMKAFMVFIAFCTLLFACMSADPGDDDTDGDDESIDDAVDDDTAVDGDDADDDADDGADDTASDDSADDTEEHECGWPQWPNEWPQSGYLIRMDGAGDIFHLWVNSAAGITHVADWLDSGDAPDTMGVPGADIELVSTFNPGYSYRMKPDEVTFADTWIEVCDAAPCYIESDPAGWVANPTQWCPWSAMTMIVWDCEGGDGTTCGDPVWSAM
jgi:hypothetical protein